MPTATLERFPRTVSACHVEIVRLRKQIEDEGPARVAELEAEVKDLEDRIEAQGKEIGELEEEVSKLEAATHPEAVNAIEQFLYEVERPVGQFNFDVVHGPAADRAILAMYDAVGRNP